MSTSGARPRALVITASDRSAAGQREDTSGSVVEDLLIATGFDVDRSILPDELELITAALIVGASTHVLIVTTGGTGLTPRDVTPQATLAVIDHEVPGLAEAMRAAGLRKTPMAALSRGVVGVRGRTLIVNVPGSPRGARESLEAIVETLPHAVEMLGGPVDHESGS